MLPVVLRGSGGARTVETPPTERRSVARTRVRRRSGANSAHLGVGRRVGARVGSGRARLGSGAASGGVGAEAVAGGARPATGGVRGARRRGALRSGSNPFTGANFEMEKL
jgi:hypothetical protein